MRDVSEKYIRLNKDFPNKAGKLRSLLETQKRLLQTLSKTKQSDKVQELMLATAEAYDVSIDLLDYTHKVLQGVATDAEVLMEGSRIRNSHKMQSEEILMLWEKLHLETKSNGSLTAQ